MDALPVPLSQVAALAEVPTGTVASWRSRGVVPQEDHTVADLCSLLLLSRLTRLGVQTKQAARIARACRDKWPDVALASPRRTLLLAKPTDGETWTIAFCSPAEVPPFGADSPTVVCDLHAIAYKVLSYVRSNL